jgi:hypothetical protein
LEISRIWENELDIVPEEDAKTSSWERLEECGINKAGQHFRKKKI